MAELQSILLYCSLFVSLFFEVFLLITYLEVRSELKLEEEQFMKPRIEASYPTVTVVVPCFNEERTVKATIESILNLDYPKDKLSLILVNDGSTDGTLKALSGFKNYPQVSIIDKENGGKHTAVNLALENVKSDLVGCLDADSFVMPEALQRIVPHFEDASVMAVTPSIKVHEPKNILQYIQKTEYSWSIFLRRMLSSMGALYVTPGPFSIFRTRVFQELGNYRYAHMTEDMEMAMRMQKNHYKIVNSHGAHVYTVTPHNIKDLVKQRARWTYGFLNNTFDYRGLLLNKSYGHFGMFIMPIAIISIFSSLFMVLNVLWGFITRGVQMFTRYQAVGFNWRFSVPSFDWYFINTGVLSIIVALAVALTLFILYLSLKLSDGKFKFHRGILYYLFLYTFMVPLWLVKALFDTAFRRKVSWR
ncbi:MAG: Glycosyltransferase involved in cell wall biogenesis [Parcubacteria group bacterium GW2011_GWA2_50_10b]|nr:MAG: Glycosyltransferase involved in cell wall biogenesis [Parcubacteria group bacterium GW2011_GWA2_50_10b]